MILRYLLYRFFGLYKDIYGSARFLKGIGRYLLLNSRNKSLVIDGKRKISKEMSYRHLVMIAPTGTGKTTSYIIPNVLNLQASAVITDPSGEIYNKTAGYLQTQGFNIKTINVRDIGNSFYFNPLHRASTFTEIKKVSEVLINSAFPGSRGDQSFWNDSAKNILNVLIRCLKNEKTEHQNLHNLRYLLNTFGSDGSPLNDFVARNTIDDQLTRDEFKGIISNDEKVIQGAVATAKTSLDKFSDPELCELTAKETLNFETLRTEKTVLYLIIPEHEIQYYGFFLSLLYSQIFSMCMDLPKDDKPYLPIYFLLDEFGNMGKLPSFSNIITTLRKRKCSCSLVLQDIEQINNIYGKSEASTIVNGGCSSKIFFPGLSLQTCEELERTLGKATIRYMESGTHKIGEETDTARDMTVGRSLLTADEIRTMNDNQAVFITGNKRPVMLKMKPYYRNRTLIARTRLKTKERTLEEIELKLDYLSL